MRGRSGSLFIENKDVFGLTVRTTISNLLNARSRWDRVVYADRRTGRIDYIEDRDRLIGRILTFRVGGKF